MGDLITFGLEYRERANIHLFYVPIYLVITLIILFVGNNTSNKIKLSSILSLSLGGLYWIIGFLIFFTSTDAWSHFLVLTSLDLTIIAALISIRNAKTGSLILLLITLIPFFIYLIFNRYSYEESIEFMLLFWIFPQLIIAGYLLIPNKQN